MYIEKSLVKWIQYRWSLEEVAGTTHIVECTISRCTKVPCKEIEKGSL